MRPLLATLALAVGSLAALASAPAAAQAKTTPRVQCGCPTARLLARGPQVLDATGGVSAWLHDGARLDVFAQDAVNKQKLHAMDAAAAPVAFEEFAAFPADHAPVPTSSRFVRARATAEVPPATYLGILRVKDPSPRDALAVRGAPGAASPTSSAPAPALRALWLAPLEQRERPGCGAWLTHRIAFETSAGGASIDGTAVGEGVPEAFLVTDQRTKASALVDARYAGVFGLGRVEVCEQGIAFEAGAPTQIEVRPVSSSFAVGDPWVFTSDGAGTTDLVRASSPPSANAERIAEAFPVPGELDDDRVSFKTVAIAVMGGLLALAALFAFITWVVIPARKRRMKDVACPSCGKGIPLDTLDKRTDGFFCPACGASGFWQGEARPLPKS